MCVPILPRILSTASFSVSALDVLTVDLDDQVIGHDAGTRGRRVVDRRDHLDDAVLHRDFDAQPAELAAGLDAHVLELLGVHVARMRIERGQHAVDGGFDHLGLVGLFDIVGADAVEHVAEQVELLVGIGIGGGIGDAEGVPQQRGRTRHPPATRPKFCNREFFISSTRLFQTADPPRTRINGLCAVPELNIQHRPPVLHHFTEKCDRSRGQPPSRRPARRPAGTLPGGCRHLVHARPAGHGSHRPD